MTPSERSLSIVIPAYNEGRRIPNTLQQVQEYLSAHRYRSEILVVDDGSTDNTLTELEKLKPSIPTLKILGYKENRGKGFAVRMGIMCASSEAVLFTDADQSTPIRELDRLWSWYDSGYDVVIGSRHLPEARRIVEQPFHRRWIGKIFNMVISLFGLRGFHDTQCGFKLFRTSAARRIFSFVKTQGWAFDVEALIRARELKYKVAEVAVRWVDASGSHIRPVRDAIRMLLEVVRVRRLS